MFKNPAYEIPGTSSTCEIITYDYDNGSVDLDAIIDEKLSGIVATPSLKEIKISNIVFEKNLNSNYVGEIHNYVSVIFNPVAYFLTNGGTVLLYFVENALYTVKLFTFLMNFYFSKIMLH